MVAPRRASLGAAVALVLGAPSLRAQAPVATPRGTFEIAANHHEVTAGVGDWDGIGARVVTAGGAASTWYLELLGQRAFGDRGVYASVANAFAFSPDWSSFVAVGGGTGEFFFPELRVDALLSRRWLPSRRLVTTAGLTAVRAKDAHRDYGALFSLTGYVGPQLVVEGGVRAVRSTPGSVNSARGFAAVTLGRDRLRYIVLRGSDGTEGYQLLGPDQRDERGQRLVRRFSSREGAVAWREWITRSWGLTAQVEHYANPVYTRTGVTLGIFRHW